MSLNSDLDALLSAAIAAGDVAGVSVQVTDRDGPLYEAGFGVRAIGRDAPMQPDTVGRIASMSKPITATAVMQLVEQGRLDLDAPAAAVLPELADAVVLTGFGPDGRPLTRPAAGPITTRQLLTHTSGFAYEFWNAAIARYHAVTATPSVATRALSAIQVPLVFDPGTDWEYGIGLSWAGRIVEAISGQSLEAYLAEAVTGPLGMPDTAFLPSASMRAREARIHTRRDDGGLDLLSLESPEPEFLDGGGGLASTVVDYGHFVRMILNQGRAPGGPLLAPATVARMSVNQIGDLRVRRLPTTNARISADAEFMPGVEKSWGLSFQINEAPAATGRSAGSLSWAGLMNSFFWIDPSRGIGGVFLSQLLPFCDARALALFERFEAATYANLD